MGFRETSKITICLIGKTPFVEKYIKRNRWYEVVFAPEEDIDSHVLSVLGVMLPALSRYFRVAMKELLPGGEIHSLTSAAVKGKPKHDKFPETMFGYWKRLLSYMPSASDLTCETFTLYATNNTAAYLAAKTEDERRIIITQA